MTPEQYGVLAWLGVGVLIVVLVAFAPEDKFHTHSAFS